MGITAYPEKSRFKRRITMKKAMILLLTTIAIFTLPGCGRKQDDAQAEVQNLNTQNPLKCLTR